MAVFLGEQISFSTSPHATAALRLGQQRMQPLLQFLHRALQAAARATHPARPPGKDAWILLASGLGKKKIEGVTRRSQRQWKAVIYFLKCKLMWKNRGAPLRQDLLASSRYEYSYPSSLLEMKYSLFLWRGRKGTMWYSLLWPIGALDSGYCDGDGLCLLSHSS